MTFLRYGKAARCYRLVIVYYNNINNIVSLGDTKNYLINSILKGSDKDIYLAALLSFVFFSISLKCNFFVFAFVDVLLCVYCFSKLFWRVNEDIFFKFEGAKLTLNFSHLMKLFFLWAKKGVFTLILVFCH